MGTNMGKFAPVAPPDMLLDLKAKGALGDYHLLLAHDIVAQKEKYREIFSSGPMPYYLILDNSVIELGEPVSAEVLEEARAVLKEAYPGNKVITVLHDFIGDFFKTVEYSRASAARWMQKDLGPFMAVPQGQTWQEFTSCADNLVSIPGVQAWGIPRHSTGKLGTRQHLANYCSVMRPHWDTHLLGFSDDLQDDIQCADMLMVKGIDSAVPIRLGLEGIRITMGLQSHSPRGNYWETAKVANELVIENLERVRGWIKSN